MEEEQDKLSENTYLDRPFYYVIVSLFISYYSLWSKVLVVWYENDYSSFLLVSVITVSGSLVPYFQSGTVFESQMKPL